MREQGGMYGKEGRYFEHLPAGFENYVWIELIGFDNTLPDFGVEKLLKTMGFQPQAMLLLVTSADFVHMHKGMDEERKLDPFFCSYYGHPYNDERPRQDWTNYQLRELTQTLQSHGIAVYISIFDLIPEENGGFSTQYPEILLQYALDGQMHTLSAVYLTKRFQDGSYYEDYFLEKILETLRDYDFDGIHLADGICRPRIPIQNGDCSDDMLSQAGIPIPPEGTDRCEYLASNYRKYWIEFCTKRWMSALEKLVKGIYDEGFKVVVNSSWTKDPMEAKYRYGVDYSLLADLPLESMVVENGGPTLTILDDQANAGYHMSYEERKKVHHMFRAMLMCVSACVGDRLSLRPLFPVRDTMEQYDVIHHMPTMLQKHAAAMFANYRYCADGKTVPVFSGHTFCLGDGLSSDNWRFLRLCSDNAYIEDAKVLSGGTVLWSDERNKKELDALLAHRMPSTTKWIAELTYRGAMIGKIAHIDDLDAVTGPLIVPNPELMPEDELDRVRAYEGGEVVYLSAPVPAEDYSKQINPVGFGFPYPLFYAPIPEEILTDAVAQINHGLASVLHYAEECHVQEILTGPNTARYIVDNEEYYYVRTKIVTGRTIVSAQDLTKYTGYRVPVEGDCFSVLVPLRGAVIIEVTFAES